MPVRCSWNKINTATLASPSQLFSSCRRRLPLLERYRLCFGSSYSPVLARNLTRPNSSRSWRFLVLAGAFFSRRGCLWQNAERWRRWEVAQREKRSPRGDAVVEDPDPSRDGGSSSADPLPPVTEAQAAPPPSPPQPKSREKGVEFAAEKPN